MYRDDSLIGETSELTFVDADLEKDRSYCYEVSAYDAGDNESDRARHCTLASWNWLVIPGWPGERGGPAIAADSAGKAEIAYCQQIRTPQGSFVYRLTMVVPGNDPRDVAPEWEQICGGPDLAFDSLSRPHVSYYGDYGNRLDVKHWAAFQETVAVGGSSFGTTAISMDQGDQVHMTYAGGNSIFYSAKEAGGAWSSRIIDQSGFCYDGTFFAVWYPEADLAVGLDGAAHMAYLAPGNEGFCEVRYASNRNGAWEVETVDSSSRGSAPPSLVVDPEGVVHIAYALHLAEGFSELRLAAKAGDTWAVSLVDGGIGAKGAASLAIGPDLELHVGYLTRSGEGELRYAASSQGNWRVLTLESEGLSGAAKPALAVDSSGRVHLAYKRLGSLVYATDRR